ncbi:MAG: hypothetical protein QOH57_1591, partial [Mycobacterium sp.]|nr:hypothetical protein [Mycobacterium sp.]
TDFNAHTTYADTGLVDQAATFTAALVQASLPAVPPSSPTSDGTEQTPVAVQTHGPLPAGSSRVCNTVCTVSGPA